MDYGNPQYIGYNPFLIINQPSNSATPLTSQTSRLNRSRFWERG